MNRIYPEIDQLLREVEHTYGNTVKTTTDFESLSVAVENKTREMISSSTLKRLWGYVGDKHKPRFGTLDILSRYTTFGTFDDFCKHLKESSNIESSFLSEKQISSKDLTKGTTVEIGWSPDRYLLLTYNGNNEYTVTESKNSKLIVGDEFTCVEFLLGHPLFVSGVKRTGSAFVAGQKNGLTLLSISE